MAQMKLALESSTPVAPGTGIKSIFFDSQGRACTIDSTGKLEILGLKEIWDKVKTTDIVGNPVPNQFDAQVATNYHLILASAASIKMPANPLDMEQFKVRGDFSTFSCTLKQNTDTDAGSATIMGQASPNYAILSTPGFIYTICYVSDTNDWRVFIG